MIKFKLNQLILMLSISLVVTTGCIKSSSVDEEQSVSQKKKPKKDQSDNPRDPQDKGVEEFLGFNHCCSNTIEDLIQKEVGTTRVFKQELDNFSVKNSASPLFLLNETGGFRHFSGSPVEIENDSLRSNLSDHDWVSIRYGMKFDKFVLSSLKTNAVLNPAIKSEYQGKFQSLRFKTLSGAGNVKIRFYRQPTGFNPDMTRRLLVEDILLESNLDISADNQEYSIDVLSQLPSAEISQIEVVLRGPSDITIDSISMDISFDKEISDVERTALFLLSSLLDGFDKEEGLSFDSARSLRRTVGYSSSVSGMFAAVLIGGVDLGFMDRDLAKSYYRLIVDKGYKTLQKSSYKGWIQHWLITNGLVDVEYSVVDSALFYLPMLMGAEYFKLPDASNLLKDGLKKLQFFPLIKDHKISLGFDHNQKVIPYYFDVIGGEFILVELLKSLANPDLDPLSISLWESWKDIGFIPEIANLLFRQFGAYDTRDKLFQFNWFQERKRVYESQKRAIPGAKIFGYSECEIKQDDDMRYYSKFGARDIAENRPEYVWVTPSYLFMTSMIEPNEFFDKFKIIKPYIAPLSSVPECMKLNVASNNIVSANNIQMSLRMIFSFLPIYHMLKSDCNKSDQIFLQGDRLMQRGGFTDKFFDTKNGKALNHSCSISEKP